MNLKCISVALFMLVGLLMVLAPIFGTRGSKSCGSLGCSLAVKFAPSLRLDEEEAIDVLKVDDNDTEPVPPPSTEAPPPPTTTLAPSATPSWGNPRFFDVFLFTNEIEILEIRIGELFHLVERFVLVETLVSFQGTPKPSLYPQLKERLPQAFQNKVFHHVCASLSGMGTWDREASARRCAKDGFVLAGGRQYDLLHFSDADEIPRPSVVTNLIQQVATIMGPTVSNTSIAQLDRMFPVALIMRMYYYNYRIILGGLRWRSDIHLWLDKERLPDMHRSRHAPTQLEDGGWHCSWCFPTVSHFKTKFMSYSHTETIDARNFETSHINDCTCNAAHLFQYRGPPRSNYNYDKRTVANALELAPPYMQKKFQDHDPAFNFLLPTDASCKLPLH